MLRITPDSHQVLMAEFLRLSNQPNFGFQVGSSFLFPVAPIQGAALAQLPRNLESSAGVTSGILCCFAPTAARATGRERAIAVIAIRYWQRVRHMGHCSATGPETGHRWLADLEFVGAFAVPADRRWAALHAGAIGRSSGSRRTKEPQRTALAIQQGPRRA